MILALLLALVHPAPALVAQAAPVVKRYHTEIRPRFQAFGYTGEMQITIQNGYVNGTYRPDTGGRLETVRGGRQGSDIWFDIATLGGVHIAGKMKPDGSIIGYGAPLGPKAGQYVFTATPEASPSPP
ncbi:MAG TPA: hypothetical protein VMF11_13665 [Candidatus Baltobacteraceae bacterium]|nr:hypothetical protein [Candidatus Baltobacteraceae bacterium]